MSDPLPSFEIERLPIAALATRDGLFIAMNRPFEALTGWTREDLIGRTLPEVFARLIAPRDRGLIDQLVHNRDAFAPNKQGSLWVRILSQSGEERPIRIEWLVAPSGRETLTLLLDAQPEAFGQEVTAALARTAGALSRCSTEDEVLSRAVDALCERGFTATALLIDGDDPLLRYGPSRSPGLTSPVIELPRPSRDILVRVNPGFLERRAAFFHDGVRIVREAYSEPVAERLLPVLPARRMVQAPLFLADEPYGALVVTGDTLTPLVATALDLFAELVGKALEAVRLRRERGLRERLAALGEAAAVMAHEVRNPVGAIMNALALLERAALPPDAKGLLSIVSEEAARLTRLVNQLLELGRPLDPHPSAISLEVVVERAVTLLGQRGGLGGRVLELPASSGTASWLDPALAELAVLNVLQNAIQSTAPTGRIAISVEVVGERARCTITDDGPGIPDAIRARLGQPFVTTRPTGTGMGLAVVRRILEASGGTMLVESAEPKGARVVLEFPRPAA